MKVRRRRFGILPALLFGTLLAPALPAQELDSLRALVRAQGVSGREEPVRREIRSRIPPGRAAEVDNLGNLTLTLGSGRPQRLVLASMDEAGYVVTQIREDGYLRVRRPARLPLSGLFNLYFTGQPLWIGSAGEGPPIPAVSPVLSTHLQRGRAGGGPVPAPRDEDLLVDLGARSAAEAKAAGAHLLAPVTLEKDLVVLGGGKIAGFGLDNRVGCEVLLRLAARADDLQGRGTLVLAWAAQSWVGGRGAERLAKRFEPDEVLVVDLYAPDPAGQGGGGPEGEPGKGPFLAGATGGGPGSRELEERIRRTAREAGVPLQRLVSGSLHDGRSFAGRPLAVVGIPVRFPGTPVEMVSREDLENLVRLLEAYLGTKP